MRQLANEAAESLELRRDVAAFRSDAELDRWVRDHFQYTPEPFEIIMHPLRAVEEIRRYGYFQGDCDDVATLYAALFKARGEPVQFEAIQTDAKQQGFQHVYARRTDTQEIFDPTVARGTRYKYLQIMVQPV